MGRLECRQRVESGSRLLLGRSLHRAHGGHSALATHLLKADIRADTVPFQRLHVITALLACYSEVDDAVFLVDKDQVSDCFG